MDATRYLPLLGRLLMGLPFLMSGFGKIAAYGPTTAYISSVGLPLAPLGFALAVVLEIGGGLCLVLGFRVRLVALVLSFFTLATAIFFHNNFADQNQMFNFLKNVVIVGGLLQIVHFGAGQYSLDTRRSRNQERTAGATT